MFAERQARVEGAQAITWQTVSESPLFLGLDVGTTTVTAVAFDPTRSESAASATLANTAYCTPAEPSSWSEMDLDRVFAISAEAVTSVVERLGHRARRLAGIGVTGQMHGVAFLDPDGRAARSTITWRDRRVQAALGSGGSYLDELKRRAGAGAFDRTGCEPAAGYLGPTLFWLSLRGELPASRVCSIPDAIVVLLTGGRPVTDPTNAAGSGVFDVVARRWDVDLLRRLGLPVEIFPHVQEAGTPVGTVTAALANAWGLRARLQVGTALGDHQASVIGSVREPLDTLHVNVGTGTQVSAILPEFTRVAGLDTRPFPGGRYLLTQAGLAGGRSFALLRDFFGRVGELLFARTLGQDELYEAMLRLAEAVPTGADGLQCSPLFAGTRPDPTLRGSVTGIGLDNFTPGHLTRAVVEGTAASLASSAAELLASAGPRGRLVGAGNGVRRNRLLAAAIAARFERPLLVPRWQEEAAVGAALSAAVGAGAGYDDAARCVKYLAQPGASESESESD